jgi:hypothetical protein
MSQSLLASQQALDEIIDTERIRKRWNKHDEQWAAEADVSVKTLQRFWSRKPIRRANFIAILLKTLIDDLKSFTVDYDADWSDEKTFVNALAVAKRKEFERFYIEFIARTVSKTEVDAVQELTEQFSEWKEM